MAARLRCCMVFNAAGRRRPPRERPSPQRRRGDCLPDCTHWLLTGRTPMSKLKSARSADLSCSCPELASASLAGWRALDGQTQSASRHYTPTCNYPSPHYSINAQGPSLAVNKSMTLAPYRRRVAACLPRPGASQQHTIKVLAPATPRIKACCSAVAVICSGCKEFQ